MNGYPKKRLKEVGVHIYIIAKTNCFDLFAHIRTALVNFRNLVYVTHPCECGLVYIGETGRNLSLHLKEHKKN